MKSQFLVLFVFLVSTTFASRTIEFTDDKGAILYTITESAEVDRIVQMVRNPDTPYFPVAEITDPFPLSPDLLNLIFKSEGVATAKVAIMIHGSGIVYSQAGKKKSEAVGTSKKLTEYIIDLIERKIIPPERVFNESLRLDNVREKANLKTEPNQRLQTMRLKLPMNSIAQGPHV